VDPIQGFLKNRLLATDTVVTNGRGAFSSSLAEYTMAAALHFNKQVITGKSG
jgi:phosphoglycerate dehydrogenase-like enzyme